MINLNNNSRGKKCKMNSRFKKLVPKSTKKDTLQNLESARKVRIKVTALSIASPSTILVTRELER